MTCALPRSSSVQRSFFCGDVIAIRHGHQCCELTAPLTETRSGSVAHIACPGNLAALKPQMLLQCHCACAKKKKKKKTPCNAVQIRRIVVVWATPLFLELYRSTLIASQYRIHCAMWPFVCIARLSALRKRWRIYAHMRALMCCGVFV